MLARIDIRPGPGIRSCGCGANPVEKGNQSRHGRCNQNENRKVDHKRSKGVQAKSQSHLGSATIPFRVAKRGEAVNKDV